MFNHRFFSYVIYTNQRKEPSFLLKRNLLNWEHNSWDLPRALGESDVIIFLSFRFFPTFFLSVPKVLFIWQPCPPQGHCALTARGKRDLRSRCSTSIWSRRSFEMVSAISATSHVPVWIANFPYFFLPLSPLVRNNLQSLSFISFER